MLGHMERSLRRDTVLMIGIVGAFGVLSAALGERIGVNGGQGWDGMSYTMWAQDFWHHVVLEKLTRYHSQRVLPSAIVHYGLRLAGQPTDVSHVIVGFQALNIAMLMLAAGLWAQLGAVMQWGRPARWVGFVALFACFANARHALYYPTLTDPMAFTLGMALVWGYLTDRRWAAWLAGLLGIPTWPALPPIAMVMLMLPRATTSVPPGPARRTRLRHGVALALAAGGTAVFLLTARRYLLHPVPGVGDEKFAQWVRRDLLVPTVAGLIAMLGGGAYVLLRDPRVLQLRGYLGQLSPRRMLGSAAAVACLLALRYAWVDAIGTRGEGPSTAQFLCEHTLAALRGPLWGPVHHVVYYGPLIAVAALAWNRVTRTAAGLGPGAVIVLAVTLAFAAGSNSRQWNHLVPFLFAMTIAATAPLWTVRRAICFLLVALPWSKLWLQIGYDRPLAFWEFPNQRYFMNHGPYASDSMYLVHLVAAVVSTLVLGWILLRASRPPRSPGPEPGLDEQAGSGSGPPGIAPDRRSRVSAGYLPT